MKMINAIFFCLINTCYTSPPNILFLFVDDLGWNDVSWNNPEVIMPNIQRLAESGLILNQAYAQSTCSPSRTALLTGYYPSRTGMQFIPMMNTEPVGLPTRFQLMPQYLKKLGYSSHILGKWHLGYCHPDYFPTNRGFDSFYGFWNGGGDHKFHVTAGNAHNLVSSVGYDFHEDEDIDYSAIGHFTSSLLADRLSEILSEHAGLQKGWFSGFPKGKILMENHNQSNPLFLYVSFQDVHTPLKAEARFEELYDHITDPIRKTYLAMVSAVDEAVGKMVSELSRFSFLKDGEEQTLLDNTIIIFMSDNGGMSEGIGYAGASNYPLRGRKGDLWEGGTRVPAFITNIGKQECTDQLFHISDWLPTIYSGFASGDISDLSNIDGKNQIDMLLGEGESAREEILYDLINFEDIDHIFFLPKNWGFPADFDISGAMGAAIRQGKYKLHIGCNTVIGCSRSYNETLGGSTDPNRILLFDLSKDPGENNNIEAEYPDVVQRLTKKIEEAREEAVQPFHEPLDPKGNPLYHFPPGQFFSGWCEANY